MANGRVISKGRLRALQRLASTDLDRKLIELTALDGLSKRTTATVSGTNNRGTVEERRRREAAIEEALEVFTAYDDLAKRDTLEEMQSLIGIEIDEEDVEREMDLLLSSGFKDADDADSEDGEDDADDGDDDDARASTDGTGWCRLPDDDAEYEELAAAGDAIDTSIEAGSAPIHSLEQDIEARVGMRLSEYNMTDDEETMVKSVIFSDRMPTDVHDDNADTDGDGTDDPRTTSLDVYEDFISDMNAAHPSDADLDADAIQPFMAAMDARMLLTRVLAWRRYKRKKEARVAARRLLANGKHGNNNRKSVLETYPNIVDAIKDIVDKMDLGASAHRDSPAMILNTNRKLEKGTGWERIRLQLREREIYVSTSSVRQLCLARRSTTIAAQRHRGLVAVKCRRSVKRLGRFNLDAHARNAFYRTMHHIRDRTPNDTASMLERDDKAKTRMGSGESTCHVPTVGDAAGECDYILGQKLRIILGQKLRIILGHKLRIIVHRTSCCAMCDLHLIIVTQARADPSMTSWTQLLDAVYMQRRFAKGSNWTAQKRRSL